MEPASKRPCRRASSRIHVTLGPAIILYKSANEGKGPFHTLATFTQAKPAGYAEGYGLFAGGRGLGGDVVGPGGEVVAPRRGDVSHALHQLNAIVSFSHLDCG